MGLGAGLLALALLTGGGAGQDAPRVVSLDYCADQYVLALADPDQILAVSVQAGDAHSALRERAAGLPRVRDAAEDVLALDPDLVVRSYGGGARARGYFARLGVDVHDLGYANDFDAVRTMVRRAADAIGHPDRGEVLIAQMEADLAAADDGPRLSALYMTPSGVTAGSGTMIDALLQAANFENAAARDGAAGWRSLPLEGLIDQEPDLVVTAFFDGASAPVDSWSMGRHPVFQDLFERSTRIELDGADVSCSSWTLAAAARRIREHANAALTATAIAPGEAAP
ncbi:MAG: ABC transporter substrate-binding protein [Alphaproteobacteria bacterium]|nr:ABC transporter substrate-binding protein [Alphaproteobacteria bacterium]